MPYTLEKARWGKAANGTRVETRRAKTAPACASCTKRFDAARAEEEPAQGVRIL